MLAARDEAFDLLNKWLAEGTLLECRTRFRFLETKLRGRVRELGADGARLESDDGTSGLLVRLEGKIDFAYGDPNISDERESFRGTLVMIFRLDEEDFKTDFVSLSEISI